MRPTINLSFLAGDEKSQLSRSKRRVLQQHRSFVHEAAMHFYNKPVTQQLELINQSGSMQSDSERQGTSK
jgi:hypothetical protein